jgi:hypothetical protein
VPVTRATLSEIWQTLPSRTLGVAASVVASSPSSTALPVSTAASAWVCHSCATAVAFSRSIAERNGVSVGSMR